MRTCITNPSPKYHLVISQLSLLSLNINWGLVSQIYHPSIICITWWFKNHHSYHINIKWELVSQIHHQSITSWSLKYHSYHFNNKWGLISLIHNPSITPNTSISIRFLPIIQISIKPTNKVSFKKLPTSTTITLISLWLSFIGMSLSPKYHFSWWNLKFDSSDTQVV